MRLFIGFQLPKDIINIIVHTQDSLQSSLCGEGIVRWIPKENIHLTTVFLGRVNDERAEDIKLAVGDISRKYEKIEFTIRSFGLWPKGKHPRIIAYNLNHPATYAQLQAELASKFAPYAPKMGTLKPAHITIGRLNKRAKAKDIQKLTDAINTASFSIKNIVLTNLLLFQSILSCKGSIYKFL